MGVKSRNWLLGSLGLAVLSYLAYRSRHLFHLSHFSGKALWSILKSVNPLYLLLSLLLIYVCYFLRAVRWWNFQRHVGQARLFHIFGMNLAGFSAVFLLGRVAEPVRPMLISRKDKIPLADTIGIYALERFLDLGCALVLLASWFVIATISKHAHPELLDAILESARKTAGTILLIAGVGLLASIVYLRFHGAALLDSQMRRWLELQGWKHKVAEVVLGIAHGVRSIRSWRDLLFAFAVSALHWFLIITIYYVVPLGLGGKIAKLRFEDAMLVLALTLVGSMIQLPGIGGGPQAVMIGAYTRLFGIPGEAAVAAAMILYVITFAAVTLAGVPILLREGWSLGELRKMREHEGEELDAELSVKRQGASIE